MNVPLSRHSSISIHIFYPYFEISKPLFELSYLKYRSSSYFRVLLNTFETSQPVSIFKLLWVKKLNGINIFDSIEFRILLKQYAQRTSTTFSKVRRILTSKLSYIFCRLEYPLFQQFYPSEHQSFFMTIPLASLMAENARQLINVALNFIAVLLILLYIFDINCSQRKHCRLIFLCLPLDRQQYHAQFR